MSRIGKNPVPLAKNVKVNIEPKCVRIEGPKGKLELNIPNGIQVEHKEDKARFIAAQDKGIAARFEA